jgi:hypothetical protein
MRYFIWMLEHRKELFRHFDINAKAHPSYPVCLDWKNYKIKTKQKQNENTKRKSS